MAGIIKEFLKDVLAPARPMTEEERKIMKYENSQREIKILQKKNFKLDSDIKGIRFVNKIAQMGIGFGALMIIITNFNFAALLGTIFAGAVVNELFKFAEKDTREKINFNQKQIEFLAGNMDAFNSSPNIENISRNMTDDDLKKGPIIDAEIVVDKQEESIVSDEYLDSIPEAKVAFDRVDELKRIMYSIGSKDNELFILFKPAVESAERTVELIHQDKSRETKAYKFYNYVEILYKWANDLNGLYEKNVYESLLTNVKEQAKKALPNLQRKINDEYYKLINPTIMDLESEMEMMSNEW